MVSVSASTALAENAASEAVKSIRRMPGRDVIFMSSSLRAPVSFGAMENLFRLKQKPRVSRECHGKRFPWHSERFRFQKQEQFSEAGTVAV
jgi:hypothetical protein